MSSRKNHRRQSHASTPFLFDDGVDSRGPQGGEHHDHTHHKSLQLCAQVAEALHMALAGECRDAVLQELSVVSVTPAAGRSRLIVTVELPVDMTDVTPDTTLEKLERASGMLRCAVAAAISRRRVPELAFRVVPPASANGGEAPR